MQIIKQIIFPFPRNHFRLEDPQHLGFVCRQTTKKLKEYTTNQKQKKMDATISKVIFSILGLVVLLANLVPAEDVIGPPVRPEVFRSPEELREYLKSLNEYFAIVGRPRFGKRSGGLFKRGFGNFAGLDVDGDGVITPADLAYYSRYMHSK